ncbi:MAG: hypothetical protein WCG66_07330 [bacterium]
MRGSRRSSESRSRIVSLFFISALTVAAAIWLGIWVERFVHSADFSQFIAARAGEALEAEATLRPLRWNGDSALSESLTLTGRESAALDRLEAKILRAQWNWRAVLSGSWKIENIEVEEISAAFKAKPFTTPDKAGNTLSKNLPPPSFLARWLPSRLEIGVFGVRKANIRFGDIQSTGQALTVEPVEGGYDIAARGGSLSIPGLPPLTHSQSHIRQRGGIYYLDDARFFLPSGGSVVASGNSGARSRLTLVWDGVPVTALPVRDLAKYLDGTSRGEATCDAEGHWNGKITFTGARLHDLPLLKNAASFLRDASWTNPPLQKLSADFAWSDGNLTLTNLVVESTGLTRMEGCVRVAKGGDLSGQIQLGLDLNTLKLLPGARETIFASSRNGWYWSKVQLDGTLSNPKEDLSPRLAACVAGAVLFHNGSQALDAVPANAFDTAKDLIHLFTPLIP